MNISKILTAVVAVISLIGVFFLIRIIMAGDEAIENSADLQGSIVDPLIWFSKLVLIATAVIAIGASILNLIKHPAALKKSLMILAIFVGLFLIAYFTASDELATDASGKVLQIKGTNDKIITGDAAVAITKRVTGMINFTGILGLIGLVLIGAGFVKSMVK